MGADSAPIVLCFGVIDEADIIEDFLRYHLSIGIDAFVAVDVGSTDGTLDLLSDHERAGHLHLTRLPNSDPDWTTPMVQTAADHYRAEWCLFGDADEFWVFAGADARAYFASAPDIVSFPRCNLVPSRDRGRLAHFSKFDLLVRRPLDFSYFKPVNALENFRSRREDKSYAATLLWGYPPEILRATMPKIAARTRLVRGLDVGMHAIFSDPPAAPRHEEQDGYIAHFPVRSLEQFRRKASLLAAAFDRDPSDPLHAWHWARLSVLYKHDLIELEFYRQLLREEEVARRLEDGVLLRDQAVADALRRLAAGSARSAAG